MNKFYSLVFLLCFSVTISLGQTVLRYEHYTIANGLSSNFTKEVEQDNYGFLWIGTIDGLNSFNGYEFTSYFNHDVDTTTLSDNSVNDLLVDKHGDLWVATNKGLNKFIRSSNTFQRFFSGTDHYTNESLTINYINQDPQGNLWLGTDKGIRIVNPKDYSIHSPVIKDDSLKLFIEEGIESIYFSKEGIVYLGSSLNKGLRMVDLKTMSQVTIPPTLLNNSLMNFIVTEFFEDSTGTLWILSENGLYTYSTKYNDLKRFVRSDAPNDTMTYSATSIIQDKHGEIWVSIAANPPYYTSIAKIIPGTNLFQIFPYVDNDDRGLSWSYCSFIFQDKSGIYWVGTSRGMDKMDPLCQQFKLYQQYTNLKYSRSNNIYAIAKDTSALWLGTDGMGLIKYNISTNKFEKIECKGLIPTEGIWSILKLDDGNLLLGASAEILLYNPSTNNIKVIVSGESYGGTRNSQVSNIIKGEGDDIWVGLSGDGLLRFNLKTNEKKLYKNDKSNPKSLGSNLVNSLFLDREGILWIGSADGVNTFGGLPGKGLDRFNAKDETFTHFVHLDNDSTSISNNNVISFAEDKNGFLWVGTRNGGLNRFDKSTGKFRRYTKNEGMPSNFISAIQVDNDNNIWVSTFTNGIACLNQSTNKIRLFDVSYGLQNIRFNLKATYQSEAGELFFGGVSGFNSFYPSELIQNTQPPPVLITGIKINNVNYASDHAVYDIKTLNLNYDQSELQFDFVALNYSQTFKNQYAYQLVGYDKDWNYSGPVRTAKYTNLDPGKYTFRVKACNNDGVWNNEGNSIAIVILPPWWQTWWAYAIYIVLIIGSIRYYITWRERMLKIRQKVLEKTVEIRTTELVAEKKEVEKQKERSDQLLLNILPSEVAEELKSKGSADAKQFVEVTVMFTDFKDFTQITEKLSPTELVAEIDTCFKAFDNIITKLNIEKIKTIGDSYMCAGGLPVINMTNANDVVKAAIEIQAFMQQYSEKRKLENKEPFEIRIGIHTGPVVAGIVGVKKFAYDIWGDTVNIASRMESSGVAGKVNISGATYQLVKDKFNCTYRGKIEAKHKGEIDMYFVNPDPTLAAI